ncbi:MAG: protein-L-isoaspartate(D-aspartate) O-methyltransferase [Bryobacteraceae bacterium]
MPWLAFVFLLLNQPSDPLATRREAMVREQMESRDIADRNVLRAIRAVPRHEFVPTGLRDQAYEDHPLPIGYDQTISQPYIVALMSQMLKVEKSHRVLEIGTGSGYQAAVLSLLAGKVYTIEIVAPLAAAAGGAMRRLGYRNVEVRHGNGYLGWPEQAPFDRILLTAAPRDVPEALIQQLKPGGRLVAPVGTGPFGQELVLIEKRADGAIKRSSGIPVRFVPMVSPP